MSMEVLLPIGVPAIELPDTPAIKELCSSVETNHEADRVKYRIKMRHKNR